MFCAYGQCTVIMNGKNGEEFILDASDEIFIPKGTLQDGKYIAGTRTIYVFGGNRIHKSKELITPLEYKN